MLAQDARKFASELFEIMVHGCGDRNCINPYCRSSSRYQYRGVPNDELFRTAQSMWNQPGRYFCRDYLADARAIDVDRSTSDAAVLAASASYFLERGDLQRVADFFNLPLRRPEPTLWSTLILRGTKAMLRIKQVVGDSALDRCAEGIGAALISLQQDPRLQEYRYMFMLPFLLLIWPQTTQTMLRAVVPRIANCVRQLCQVQGSGLPSAPYQLQEMFSGQPDPDALSVAIEPIHQCALQVCQAAGSRLTAVAQTELHSLAVLMSLIWRAVRSPDLPTYMRVQPASFELPRLSTLLDMDREWQAFTQGTPQFLRFPFLFSTEAKVCILRAEAATTQKSLWGHTQEVSVGRVMNSGAHEDLIRERRPEAAPAPDFMSFFNMFGNAGSGQDFGGGGGGLSGLFGNLFGMGRQSDSPPPVPKKKFCYFKLRRGAQLVKQTLDQLDAHILQCRANPKKNPLLRPLYIEFEGEGAIDQGGVTREFFQLLSQELFKPDGPLFSASDNERFLTFRRNITPTPELQRRFFLVGVLFGLALFNNVLLDVSLPAFVYRRLLGKKPAMRDIYDFKPEVYDSLRQLLEYDESEGRTEDVFSLDYSVVERDANGRPTQVDLRPNGRNIPVTAANRADYVQCLINYFVGSGVDAQMRPFAQGFQEVVGSLISLRLFTPEDLERALTGSKQLDWEALRRNAVYDNGYTADSPQMVWFWDVVLHDLTETERRQLLQFVTGCSRAPVGGLSRVHMKIVRQGRPDQLPTSHTCMDILCVPPYKTREQLRERLRTAIPNCVGFGFK